MLCIQTPKSEAILCVGQSVSQCVSIFENEKTCDISESIYSLAGRLSTSNSKLFRRPLLLPACCCHCVLNCSRFFCVGKILKSFLL